MSLKISTGATTRRDVAQRHAPARGADLSRARNASTTAMPTTICPRHRRASRVALALVFVFAAATRALAVVPTLRGLPHLDDASFEHETQASSGQTTGTWLVLFTNGDSPRGARAERALVVAKDGLLEDGVVAASIDAQESPETFDRFRFVVKRTPSVVVLRGGKAYAREVKPDEDGDSARRFATETFGTEGVEYDIPRPLTYIQKMFARITSALAMAIVRLYSKTEKMTHVLKEDYAAARRAFSRDGLKATRTHIEKAISNSSSEYGLLFMIIGCVIIVTAGVLAVITFPPPESGRRKTKTE